MDSFVYTYMYNTGSYLPRYQSIDLVLTLYFFVSAALFCDLTSATLKEGPI